MRLMVSMIGMNREAGTRESVEAVLRSTAPFYLSLTNQNSSDGTGRYFDEVARRHPDRVTVFHETQNTFFQPPNNRAYHMAAMKGCDFFLCLNDDAIIPTDGLQKMMAVMDANPMVAVVGAKGGCEELSDSFHGQHGRLEFVEGSCAMYRIAAMRMHRPTLFWDQLQGIYSEDSEASLFLQEKGWSIAKADFDLPHARSSTVNRDAATQAACRAFQDRNHELCTSRYAHWLKHRRFDFPIYIRRSYAIGDVLLTTPIIRAIAKSNPLSPIYVQTDFPEIFKHNPYVQEAAKNFPPVRLTPFNHGDHPDGRVCIDLDGSYENMPMTHIVHAYEAKARTLLPGLAPVELRTELHPTDADKTWASNIWNTSGNERLALIGSDLTTWRGKNWPGERFSQIRHRLERAGWKTLSVGSKGQELQTTIHQLAAIMGAAKLFIGNDSFCMHAAQAMGCPTVGIFGPTLPRFIFTQGSKAAAAVAQPHIPCAGERHRVKGKTFVDCNADCINSVTVDDVWKAIERLQVL